MERLDINLYSEYIFSLLHLTIFSYNLDKSCRDCTKRFVSQTNILPKPQIAWKHNVSTEEKYKMKLTPDAPINNLPLW